MNMFTLTFADTLTIIDTYIFTYNIYIYIFIFAYEICFKFTRQGNNAFVEHTSMFVFCHFHQCVYLILHTCYLLPIKVNLDHLVHLCNEK